jgi:hypothetical protein
VGTDRRLRRAGRIPRGDEMSGTATTDDLDLILDAIDKEPT